MRNDALRAATLILVVGLLTSSLGIPGVFVSKSHKPVNIEQEFAMVDVALLKQ